MHGTRTLNLFAFEIHLSKAEEHNNAESSIQYRIIKCKS